MKRYTAFNFDREQQQYFDDFKEAYKFAKNTLPSIEDGFNINQAKKEMDKMGLTSIPERNFVNIGCPEFASIVDTTKHKVWDDGYYEW